MVDVTLESGVRREGRYHNVSDPFGPGGSVPFPAKIVGPLSTHTPAQPDIGSTRSPTHPAHALHTGSRAHTHTHTGQQRACTRGESGYGVRRVFARGLVLGHWRGFWGAWHKGPAITPGPRLPS